MKLEKVYVLALILGLLAFGCSKDDDTIEEPQISCTDGIQNGNETGVDCGGDCGLCGPPTSGFYFYGVIDGEEVIVSGANATGAGLYSCDANIEIHNNGGGWILDISNLNRVDASVWFYKGFPRLDPPEDDDFYAMFAEGNYSYEPLNGCDATTIEAEISWTDDADQVWASSAGSQAGSTFTITDRGPSNGFTAIISGEFSCKLYNGTKVKTLESGKFRFELGLF